MADYSSAFNLAALVAAVLALSACETSPNYVSMQDPKTGALVICRGPEMNSCGSGYASQGWVALPLQIINPAAGK
jgi:hypothetical protein